MRYVIVSVVKGKAGNFNNNLRKEIFNKFKARFSKLPAHFTIKSPFETDNVSDLENLLDTFSKHHKATPYKINGYDKFDKRVIFMKVIMSDEGKRVHDILIDSLSNLPYINFDSHDGKDKTFHVTISSKKIQHIFSELWDYVTRFSCDFQCSFDNICLYKWEDNTWKLHKEIQLL